jgi:hypothetical protein
LFHPVTGRQLTRIEGVPANGSTILKIAAGR